MIITLFLHKHQELLRIKNEFYETFHSQQSLIQKYKNLMNYPTCPKPAIGTGSVNKNSPPLDFIKKTLNTLVPFRGFKIKGKRLKYETRKI